MACLSVTLALAGPGMSGGGLSGGPRVTTATAPLVVTGSDVSCTAASASSGGCLTRSGGKLVVDAGQVNTSVESSTFAGPVVLTPGPLQVGGGGISTDAGIISDDVTATALYFRNSSIGAGITWEAGATDWTIKRTTTSIVFDKGGTYLELVAATGVLTTPFGYASTVASGGVAIQTLTGARTALGTSGVGWLAYQAASASIEQSVGVGTAGSGTGYTVIASGAIRPFVHKITVTYAAMTAAGTTDVTVWTLPSKTRMSRMIDDVTTTFTGGALSAVSVTCGTTAGGNEYLLAHSAYTAAATFGDVAAEIGAGLLSATVADIPSFSATTAIICRFTCTGANCSAATAGSATYYLEGVTYP
jgi:hypothetical protein